MNQAQDESSKTDLPLQELSDSELLARIAELQTKVNEHLKEVTRRLEKHDQK